MNIAQHAPSKIEIPRDTMGWSRSSGQLRNRLPYCSRLMFSEVTFLVLVIGVLTAVASLGTFRGRNNGAWVLCALIPMGLISSILVGYVDTIFSEPSSLQKSDIIEFGPGVAAATLPIYIAGLISLIQMFRKNKGSVGMTQVSATKS